MLERFYDGDCDANALSPQALAFIGDSVFNLFVKEKTPPEVSKTIDTTTNFLEDQRTSMKDRVENKKENISISLKEDTKNDNKIIKPFKYVAMFILSLFNFILSNICLTTLSQTSLEIPEILSRTFYLLSLYIF